MSVIRGSFFGPPFCFARFAGVVEKDLDIGSEVVREALAVKERDRKDCRRGERSRDTGVCMVAIVSCELVRDWEE